MPTLEALVRDRDALRRAIDQSWNSNNEHRRKRDVAEAIPHLRAAVRTFFTSRNNLAKRGLEFFGERTNKPDTSEELMAWYLYTKSEVGSDFRIDGLLFEDGAMYLYSPDHGLLFADDALLQNQQLGMLERLNRGVASLQDNLEHFVEGTSTNDLRMLKARLKFEIEMTILWYVKMRATQTFIYSSRVTSKELKGHLRWYLNSDELCDDEFRGSGFVQSNELLYLLRRNGTFAHVDAAFVNKLSHAKLSAIISAVRLIREPVYCIPELIPVLRSAVEESLAWCRSVIENDEFIYGTIMAKPDTGEELVSWYLRTDTTMSDETDGSGRLFSDGSIYWKVAGKLTLIDDTTLLQQPMRSVHIIISSVRNVLRPTLMLKINSRIG